MSYTNTPTMSATTSRTTAQVALTAHGFTVSVGDLPVVTVSQRFRADAIAEHFNAGGTSPSLPEFDHVRPAGVTRHVTQWPIKGNGFRCVHGILMADECYDCADARV